MAVTPYGDKETKELVQAVAGTISVGVKLVKGGGFLTIFELMGPLGILRGVDFDTLKHEIQDLDPTERADLEQAFVQAITVEDKALAKKITDSADALNNAIDLVEEVVGIWDNAKALLDRVKAIIGV